MKLFKPLLATLFLSALSLVFCSNTKAQINSIGQQLSRSQQFRLGDRIVRVAEPGQLSDTLNVWGDVNSPGRYLIPEETTLPELLSYCFGPNTIRSREAQLDWSKIRVEINVSEYDSVEGMDEIKSFEYRFNEPLPKGMRSFDLNNNQVVSVQVKRKPSFVDYVRVVAPVISSIATGILIIDRL